MPSNHLILCHHLLLLPPIPPSIRVFSNESTLLKSLLQHHSSKASILRRSAFFTVQLSRPYMTTGKTIALTRRTLAGKLMSLLFNMLSRLVITFLPRSKRLLISWLQSPSAVILESVIKSLWIPSFHPFVLFLQDVAISFLSSNLSFWVNYISSFLSLVDGWQIRAHPHPVFTWDKRARKWRPRQRRSRRRDIDGKIRYICLFTFQRCGWRGLIWLNS